MYASHAYLYMPCYGFTWVENVLVTWLPKLRMLPGSQHVFSGIVFCITRQPHLHGPLYPLHRHLYTLSGVCHGSMV